MGKQYWGMANQRTPHNVREPSHLLCWKEDICSGLPMSGIPEPLITFHVWKKLKDRDFSGVFQAARMPLAAPLHKKLKQKAEFKGPGND